MNTQRKVNLALRIFISILFLLSAVAKMFPIWAFEKQLVDLGITGWCGAHYLSRLIIALEAAIGIAILLPYYTKRIVIPGTILLLTAFCIHLSTEIYKHGGMSGNCGCFGQLIPMTPLEALIKNIVSIGILIYLYVKSSEQENKNEKAWSIFLIYFICAWIMFAAFPFCPCEKTETQSISEPLNIVPMSEDSAVALVSSNKPGAITEVKNGDHATLASTAKDSMTVGKVLPAGPKSVTSKFSKYTQFGNIKMNPDEGQIIMCQFVPGCDHCRDAAKEIGILSQKSGFPKVYILFMDEEVEKIPEFQNLTGTKFPYRVLDIPEFWGLMGSSNTPAVNYMWNGNIIKTWQGTEENKFKPEELKKIWEVKNK